MKRSEAIKIISEILAKSSLETNEYLADKILAKLSQLGMLPPSKDIQDPEFPNMPNYSWDKEK